MEIPGRSGADEARGEGGEQWRLALQAASLGTWSCHPATGTMEWSAETERIIDLRRSREPGFERHLTRPVDLDEPQRLLDPAAGPQETA